MIKEHRAEIIVIIIILAIFAILLIPSLVTALAGYDYTSELTLTNNTGGTYKGRIIVDTFPKAIYDGGFIYQSDGQDIFSPGADICALGLSDSGTQPWLYYAGAIAAGNYNTTVNTGSHNAERDQKWIAAGSDTFTVSDHNDLDVEIDFMLEATINLFDTQIVTSGTRPIIMKYDSGGPTGYALFIMPGTPTIHFLLADTGGITSELTLNLNIDTEYNVKAWYYSGSMVLDIGTDQTGMAFSGSVSQNAEDLQICEFAGLCDDISIKGA